MPVVLTTSRPAGNSPSVSTFTCDAFAESLSYDPASQVTNILHRLTTTRTPFNQAG